MWSCVQCIKGPKDLGKYTISSNFWKNWTLPKLFDFLKVVRNIDISNLEPKCFFCWCFLMSHSILKHFPQTWNLQLYLYEYSHGKDIKGKAVSKVLKIIQAEMRITEHLLKKEPDFVLFLCGDFNISDNFCKIQTIHSCLVSQIITNELILS